MVTGEHPFDGNNYNGVLVRNQIGDINLEHPLIQECGPLERNLLEGMLEPTLEKRITLEQLETLAEELGDHILEGTTCSESGGFSSPIA